MTKEEKDELTELCDRIYYAVNIDVDDIEGLERLYTTVKRLIKYKANIKRFENSLFGSELETFKRNSQ